MWINLLILAELAVAIIFIAKGELANRGDLGRDFGRGRAFYVIGVAAFCVFLSTSVVWLAH
jgi:hypothetical protein